MCKCDSNIQTPYCGKPGCRVPAQSGSMIGSAYPAAAMHDVVVAKFATEGRPLDECIDALVADKQRLIDELLKLHMIIPKKIKLPDGSIAIYRCPPELVPEIPTNNIIV